MKTSVGKREPLVLGMYRDWTTVGHLFKAAARSSRPVFRVFYVAACVVGMVPSNLLVHCGRLLDYLFHPGFRKAEVRQPFFIFANARSGTTLLHRLMCLDDERFTHVRLYQTILHSLVLTGVSRPLGWLDDKLRGRLTRLRLAVDRAMFGVWKDIHPMGLNDPEEDEGFFVPSLLTPGIFAVYPWVTSLERVVWLDRLERSVRQRVMREYVSLVRRQVHRAGNKQYLNKNVLLAGRLESVLEAFPDARFVYLVRNPYESIPSYISMLFEVWKRQFPEIDKRSPEVRALADLGVAYYRRGLDFRRQVPADRLLVVRYTDLVRDPLRTVTSIYAHFGMTMSERFKERLQLCVARHGEYHSKHQYQLEEFGLTRSDIYHDLRDVFEEFGFEP